jgi:hypothetical protein
MSGRKEKSMLTIYLTASKKCIRNKLVGGYSAWNEQKPALIRNNSVYDVAHWKILWCIGLSSQ